MKNNILSMRLLLEMDYIFYIVGYNLFLKDDVGTIIAKILIAKNHLFVLPIQIDVSKYLRTCYKNHHDT